MRGKRFGPLAVCLWPFAARPPVLRGTREAERMLASSGRRSKIRRARPLRFRSLPCWFRRDLDFDVCKVSAGLPNRSGGGRGRRRWNLRTCRCLAGWPTTSITASPDFATSVWLPLAAREWLGPRGCGLSRAQGTESVSDRPRSPPGLRPPRAVKPGPPGPIPPNSPLPRRRRGGRERGRTASVSDRPSPPGLSATAQSLCTTGAPATPDERCIVVR